MEEDHQTQTLPNHCFPGQIHCPVLQPLPYFAGVCYHVLTSHPYSKKKPRLKIFYCLGVEFLARLVPLVTPPASSGMCCLAASQVDVLVPL